jgi:hypothetical protein
MGHSWIKKLFHRDHKPFYKNDILPLLLVALPYLYMVTIAMILLLIIKASGSIASAVELLSFGQSLLFTFIAGIVAWCLYRLISHDIDEAHNGHEKIDHKSLIKMKMDRIIVIKLFLTLILAIPLILLLRIGYAINLNEWAVQLCNFLVSAIIFICGVCLIWMIIKSYVASSKKYQLLEEKS